MNIIRRLNKHLRRKPPAPRRTKSPWTGFTKHDMARAEPLTICPSARCRRAKACIAAVDNLYCLRTHHSLEEVNAIRATSALRKELDSVPPVIDLKDPREQLERISALAAIRRSHEAEQLQRWKSGATAHLYGPYRAAGVILAAPPKAYVEGPKTGVDKPVPPSYRARQRPRFPGPSCHSGAGD